MDIPNIEAVSFPKAVERAVNNNLASCRDYDDFRKAVVREIDSQINEICDKTKNVYMFPAPFLSLMVHTDAGKDVSSGLKYNNYGIHGTGIATAVDSLAAVKKYVFEDKTLSAEHLISALKNNFKNEERLCGKLRFDSPKFGNNDDCTNEIACKLIDDFASLLKNRRNDRGGIFRGGTGSAMYYIWHADNTQATPDGRLKNEWFPANYSPSLFVRCKGPVSIIKSFCKPDLKKVINGGPLTIELHDSMFKNADGISKTALMVKSFIDLGGHQLQLNSVNRDTMIDAQKHPENYKNLIVRVWGWSGYFVELDKEYQDHIIKRSELIL